MVIVELNSHPELIMRLHKERVQCSNIANELMEVNRYKIKAILDRFMLRHTMQNRFGMLIGQDKPTMVENFRFVQQILTF